MRRAMDPTHLFWAAFALVVPFGWVVLLCRLEPVRVRLRALRPR